MTVSGRTPKGAPSVTSTSSGAARPGRDLEVLAALVERLLAGSPVEITSPAHIVGRAGVEREVDVAIRGRVGSAPIFVMVE